MVRKYFSRKGSLQFWHHRRASKRLPRLRSGPIYITEPSLTSIVAFKAGMTHVQMTDDSESASKNQEISRPVTVLEVLPMELYGIRFYLTDPNTKYKRTSTEVINKTLAKKLNIEKIKNDETKLDSFKQRLGEFSDLTALIVAYPKSTSTGQHHLIRFESYVGGKNLDEKFNFLSSLLGKEITSATIFKNGEFVDVSSISKGKGWQGAIKRFGVATMPHKATKKVRHVGALGPFKPPKVYFSVPQAGQMGFNYRTEHNKRIIKLGARDEVDKINNRAGFVNYGNVSNDYMLLYGSVVGPTNRLVRVRKSILNRNARGIKEPKVTHIAK